MNTTSSSVLSHSSKPAASSAPTSSYDYRAVARDEARAALADLQGVGLQAQAESSRVLVEIGGVKTYWNRPLGNLPPYCEVRIDVGQTLLVWRAEAAALDVFYRAATEARFTLARRETKHSRILKALPRHLFGPGKAEQPASFKQLVMLRTVLALDATAAIPDIHISAVTRLLNRVFVEPTLWALCAAHPAARGEIGGDAS